MSFFDPFQSALTAGQLSSDGSQMWDGYNWGWNSPDPNLNFDPKFGTNVNYGTGITENFPQGQNPSLFLNAGSNYADTGGMKAAVPGTDLYNQLSSDERTRNQQGILKVGALVGGGAALGATPWGSASDAASESLSPVTLPSSASYISPTAAGVGSPADAAVASVGPSRVGFFSHLGQNFMNNLRGGNLGGLSGGGYGGYGSQQPDNTAEQMRQLQLMRMLSAILAQQRRSQYQ